MNFSITTQTSLFMHCTFDSAGGLVIGRNSTINSNCRLDTRGTISIGDNVSISSDVIILTADHDLDAPDFCGRNRAVVINDYAWIGTRAMILPGVTIGKGAIVAACALVSKDVAEYDVVAGVPAKVVKNRPKSNLEYNSYYSRLFQ
jgi:maltose O-acetyltransferase